ncbi:MAG: DUF1598 domain-containing protein [Calditrichaeota bacterium]|nr:MAG: DUF1598 domain-containing protein [Calditrichota bacterium]
MKRFILFLLVMSLIFLLPGTLPPACSADEPGSDYLSGEFGRAVSLRVLFEQLEPYHTSGNYPDRLNHLCGITRIYGYVVDTENQDLILFGIPDPERPPLYLEDLVIALKNAWHHYDKVQGRTHYYSYPGCSIDPSPAVLKKLDWIGKKILQSKSEEEVEKWIEEWHRVCRSDQGVRVMGVPFNSRFAKVMVTADYDMKRVADGSDSLGLPGFSSLGDLTLEEVKQALQQNRPVSVPIGTVDQFWFYPGQNIYDKVDGAMVISKCPVTLLTKMNYLTKSGQLVQGSEANPLAARFAESLTRRYEEVAGVRPIYRELEGLFRWVALAKIIEDRRPHRQAGPDIEGFISAYRVGQTHVDTTLPGRSRVQRYTHRKDFEGGYQIAQFWLPSCGGVKIEISMQQAIIRYRKSGAVIEQTNEVRRTRPGPQSLTWDFPLMMKIRRDPQETKEREFVRLNPEQRILN